MSNKKISTIIFFCLVLIAFGIYPCVSVALSMSQPNQNEISAGWQEACNWLRDNTTEPSDYYALESKPTWGVMSWWDYGYWIIRDGQRPAMIDPGSNVRYKVALDLLSPNYEDVHNQLVAQHVRYIIIDYLMVTSKYYAIDTLAHEPSGELYVPTKYQQAYEYWDQRQNQPVMLNFPDYYQSLIVRLYNFNGLPVKSPGCPVFQTDKDKNIIHIDDFPDYQTALAFQQKNGGIIAGSDPFLSPLAENDTLNGFNLVWQSKNMIKMGDWSYPEVKIFEVTP